MPPVLSQTLADATDEAIETARDVMRRGGFQDRLAAAKIILDRTMPVPKASPAAIAAAAAGASAGAADRVAALAKAAERQAARLLPTADSVDATFTPLARVQKDE